MNVVLIAPPWIFKEEVEFVSQNLGLGYLASYLENQGHDVIIIDAFFDGINKYSPLHTKYTDVLRWGLSEEEIIRLIPTDTDIIGITAPFTDSRFVVNPLSKELKKVFPSATLIMGGVYPSTLPSEAMKLSGADILVIGEGEIALSQIVAGRDWEKIKGIVFRRDGKVFETGKGIVIKDIEKDLLMPSYDLRPMAKYVEWSPRGNKADKTLSVISSRGCPFRCNFCSIHPVYGHKWRAFSSQRVVGEIQMAIERFSISHIEFEDDNLTLEKNRAMDIFEGIKNLKGRSGEKIYWSAPNGVMIHSLDKEIIFKMRESGAELIYLPVESGDKKILKLMNKAHWENHLEKALEVATYCAEAKIESSAFVIIGYPGEDAKSFEKTLDFCRRLMDAGINRITPLIATPYPNTNLYCLCEKNGWLVHPDAENVLTYQRYSDFLPEFVHIETPWCSKEEAFQRYQIIRNMFPIRHNVRKEEK